MQAPEPTAKRPYKRKVKSYYKPKPKPKPPEFHKTRLVGEDRQQAWQSMRIFCTFDTSQILATATISVPRLRIYLLALEAAGYVVIIRPKTGRGTRHLYRLVRNTGPLAPLPWCDGQVYDQNQRKTYDGCGVVES
jgi:hypothetical protein